MTTPRLHPIYTTRGDCGAYLVYPFIFNQLGEWIGWVTAERQVYSVHGQYVGWLSKDPRILSKRGGNEMPNRKPPPRPRKISVPASVPLPPLMSEIGYETVDVLGEDPDQMPTLDSGEGLQDMD